MTEIQFRTVWERHFQTVIGLAVLALGVWVVNTMQLQTVALAVQTEKIRVLTIRIDSLTLIASHQYTSEDAARDFAGRDAEIQRIYGRLRVLERVDRQ